ncbi:hypothetical protein BC936DRAFT_142179 [Jimgerdemannia flammicorona]|uniref:Prokaryotic-type class I peptide chain release factors domain-containing protein n=1 Tax=Jimgerdemannia flammicorona TaxID=994334 RepID=A0A433A0R7_9FUNG|nr:hypothetical protein BC936DRAFT_142179 [Jimgerdemannia flammicorona]
MNLLDSSPFPFFTWEYSIYTNIRGERLVPAYYCRSTHRSSKLFDGPHVAWTTRFLTFPCIAFSPLYAVSQSGTNHSFPRNPTRPRRFSSSGPSQPSRLASSPHAMVIPARTRPRRGAMTRQIRGCGSSRRIRSRKVCGELFYLQCWSWKFRCFNLLGRGVLVCRDLINRLSTWASILALETFTITYSRSSGPGGQNVNKVSTKVDLRFKLASATWIPEYPRSRLAQQNASRLNKLGEYIVTSDRTRTQRGNIEDCIDKLYREIREAAEVPKEPDEETLKRIAVL